MCSLTTETTEKLLYKLSHIFVLSVSSVVNTDFLQTRHSSYKNPVKGDEASAVSRVGAMVAL